MNAAVPRGRGLRRNTTFGPCRPGFRPGPAACGVLAVDDNGRALLQRRRDTGQWAIPMGEQELG
jgi:8-oxo-dGTP pyrophosphatase MutT (NUDIX family)